MQYQNFSVQLKFSLTTTNDRYNFACLPAQFVVAPKSELVSLLFFFAGVVDGGEQDIV